MSNLNLMIKDSITLLQYPIITVKHLGIFLDRYMLRTKQVNWVNSKPNQTTEIVSKLRYNTRLPILKIVYHYLFESHLQYCAKICGQGSRVNHINILLYCGLGTV